MHEELEQLTLPLLMWYQEHKRDLPWRNDPQPYRVWVSEIMLQQTRVAAVLDYYRRFMDALPTVEDLAEVPEDALMKLWQGLGYYSRARNLQKAAKQIVSEHGGQFPGNYEDIRALPGVGDYTAGAVASIAFGIPVPAVDGNVIRVTSRLRGIRENLGIPSVKRQIAAEAAALVSRDRPGDFNQAMMDLGATVCTPGTPSCEKCPLCARCDAYAEGDAEDIPQLPRRNPPKEIEYDLCLIYAGGRVLMRQRTEVMLGGLWVYPMIDGWHTLKQLPAAVKRKTGVKVSGAAYLGEAKHVFTHQVWKMKIYAMQAEVKEDPAGWRFVTLEEMNALAIPTAVKAAVKQAREALS